MRDLLLFALVFGSLPFAIGSPQIGVYLWTWLSYMNPHKLVWGAALNFPFAQIVAIVVFFSMIFNFRQVKKPIINGTIIIWVMFLLWMIITTANAVFPENAQFQLSKVLKIQIIVFVVLLVIRDKTAIHNLLWVTFLSLAFFGIKGGVFVMLTGGQGRVWGPEGTFIADNNHLAVALLMTIPLGYYLYLSAEKTWVKRMMLTFLLLTFISVVASYSRGAFLAIAAVGGYFWWSSKAKFRLLAPLVLVIPLVFMLMPEKYTERISTLRTYQEDKSAMGRINAWGYAVNVANDRLTGAGFESWSLETFYIWGPDPDDVHSAHSIYFGVLADHGWPGLIMFLLILALSWRRANRVIKLAKDNESIKWAGDMCRMIKISLVAYCSGGAFLSLAYFDLPWQLMATLILIEVVALEELAKVGQEEAAPEPATALAAMERVN